MNASYMQQRVSSKQHVSAQHTPHRNQQHTLEHHKNSHCSLNVYFSIQIPQLQTTSSAQRQRWQWLVSMKSGFQYRHTS
jgi:hypothetical protein